MKVLNDDRTQVETSGVNKGCKKACILQYLAVVFLLVQMGENRRNFLFLVAFESGAEWEGFAESGQLLGSL